MTFNAPSLGWLYGHYKKYINKWAEFEVVNEENTIIPWFREQFGFDDSKTVTFRGLFLGFLKKPPRGVVACLPQETELHLVFRKVSISQDKKTVGIDLRELAFPIESINFRNSFFQINETLRLAGLTNQSSF